MLKAFPLLAISVLVYTILVFAIGYAAMPPFLDRTLIDIPLFSGDRWNFRTADLILIISFGFLFAEIMKSASNTRHSLLNHSLSLIVGIVALIEFLMLKGFGSTVFFVIICMTMIDVIAGFSITIVASRRQMDVVPNAGG